ncbi:hypothetical protein NC651_000280 [Populus alba x Populus x berolinensis]|nr:hypothetical protein NC651_000280 [Populus alba x Populus x berolinensis]
MNSMRVSWHFLISCLTLALKGYVNVLCQSVFQFHRRRHFARIYQVQMTNGTKFYCKIEVFDFIFLDNHLCYLL